MKMTHAKNYQRQLPKNYQEFSRSYSQAQSADMDFFFLSTLTGSNWNPAPFVMDYFSSWKTLLLFSDYEQHCATKGIQQYNLCRDTLSPSSLPFPKVWLSKPPLQVQTALFHLPSFLQTLGPPCLHTRFLWV